ncbi:hypothetical protein ABTY61_30585 [Kitasatospora sp. NPDC096128]|uniref:hypothetical protein n=1 Tax=Kitasatospora sp. NPDC096128 TaxID=3155547 RepID=UPI00331EDBF9
MTGRPHEGPVLRARARVRALLCDRWALDGEEGRWERVERARRFGPAGVLTPGQGVHGA